MVSEQPVVRAPDSAMARRLVLVMAVATGLAVANNYYAQPLLATIARDFGVSSGAAGSLITVSQVGYAVGLLAVVPLGDLLERRRLITSVLALSVLALLAAGRHRTSSCWRPPVCWSVSPRWRRRSSCRSPPPWPASTSVEPSSA